MVTLPEIKAQVAQLAKADQESLIAYLIDQLPPALPHVSDEAILKREAEMDAGATLISHDDFVAEVLRDS